MMKVHPAADIFPMVPDDGLASLADSIKANGLRFPIIIRRNGHGDELIDGRNRLRACEIAGVEPAFVTFDGDDDAVRAYIADVNLERRDLKKGQKAMAYAMLYPDPSKGGRGKNSLVTSEFSQQRLSQARIVLRHSPALADDVIYDRVPLDKALEQVKTEQQRSMGNEARLTRLRIEAQDLADLVEDERLTLDEACAANEKRQEEREYRLKKAREAASSLWREIGGLLGIIAHGAELGEPYVLPDNERETAENILYLLTEIVNGKK